MKRILTRGMISVIVVAMALIVLVNFALRYWTEHKEFAEVSQDYFWQMARLSEQCQADIDNIKTDFSVKCLELAKAAAYVIQGRSDMETNLEELQKFADIQDVDQIHLINEKGEIYFGTHPEYYNYTFEAGEQMQFFSPMLEDKSLALCQEIGPNTAQGKIMQYAAVWREDGKGIVQVGMEPSRVMDEIERKSMSWVLSMIPVERNSELYILNSETGLILASTKKDHVELESSRIGLTEEALSGNETKLFHAEIDGGKNCIVAQRMGDSVFVRTYPSKYLYSEILMDTGFLIGYVVILSLVAIFAILHYMNSKLIKGLHKINHTMQAIGSGTQDDVEDDTNIPELSELSYAINQMLYGVRITLQQFVTAIEHSKLPIGVYEHSALGCKAYISAKVWDILNLPRIEREASSESAERIQNKIKEIKQHVQDAQEHIYIVQKEQHLRYIRIEEFKHDQSMMAVLVDVTREWTEKAELKQQRDSDVLTNLYNRRGFLNQVDILFLQKDVLQYAAVIILDADGLKLVNDRYGHTEGDRYLGEISDIILDASEGNSICARFGGDEFAILLYGCDSITALMDKIQKLESCNDRRPMSFSDGSQILVKYSFGYAVCPEEGEDPRTLMRKADDRMYEMKRKRYSQI